MRRLMGTLVFFVGTISTAAETPQSICSRIAPELFSISDDGNVSISETSRRRMSYGYERRDGEIVFSGRAGGRLNGQALDRIKLDGRRATEIQYQGLDASVSGFVTIWKTNARDFVSSHPGRISLGYNNGRCFVREVRRGSELVANSEMCRKLIVELSKAKDCAASCSSSATAGLNRIFSEYGASTQQAQDLRQDLRLATGNPAVDQAMRFLASCHEIEVIRASMTDESLWTPERNSAQPQPRETTD